MEKQKDVLYHISGVGGLKQLDPSPNGRGNTWVYATKYSHIALLFGGDWSDNDFILKTKENGKISFSETYPNAFDDIYTGKSCYLYEIEDSGFSSGRTTFSLEIVSEKPARVLKETKVDDVKKALLDEVAKGSIELKFYEKTLEYRQMVSNHMINLIIKFDILTQPNAERIMKYFGELKKYIDEALTGKFLV